VLFGVRVRSLSYPGEGADREVVADSKFPCDRLREASDQQYLNPAYGADSAANSTGDSLHPNDVGYQAMAAAVPLPDAG
jgi:lysophospholipase L1-like esterase